MLGNIAVHHPCAGCPAHVAVSRSHAIACSGQGPALARLIDAVRHDLGVYSRPRTGLNTIDRLLWNFSLYDDFDFPAHLYVSLAGIIATIREHVGVPEY
jgi:hypothetical protein